MAEKSPTHQGGKQNENHANFSQYEKSAKTTKPDKEGCWICGKMDTKRWIVTSITKDVSFEEKKGNWSFRNDPTVKVIPHK